MNTEEHVVTDQTIAQTVGAVIDALYDLNVRAIEASRRSSPYAPYWSLAAADAFDLACTGVELVGPRGKPDSGATHDLPLLRDRLVEQIDPSGSPEVLRFSGRLGDLCREVTWLESAR